MTNSRHTRRFARRKTLNTLKTITVVISLIISAQAAYAQDAFDAVQCGADIPKATIGKVLPSGRVVVIESKHRVIGLKNEGGTEISDTLFLSGWTLCNSEYEFLIDQHDVIRDALLFMHSMKQPAFVGTCRDAGREMQGTIIAELDIPVPLTAGQHYTTEDNTLVPAISAWRIDETRQQFVKLPVEHLRCPRNGIFTSDGGP